MDNRGNCFTKNIFISDRYQLLGAFSPCILDNNHTKHCQGVCVRRSVLLPARRGAHWLVPFRAAGEFVSLLGFPWVLIPRGLLPSSLLTLGSHRPGLPVLLARGVIQGLEVDLEAQHASHEV